MLTVFFFFYVKLINREFTDLMLFSCQQNTMLLKSILKDKNENLQLGHRICIHVLYMHVICAGGKK